MKFFADVWRNDWYLLPCLRILFNEAMYANWTFAIEFHFLCFHVRMFWEDGDWLRKH